MTQKHVVYGLHAVKALVSHHPATIKTLFVQDHRNDKRAEEILALARQKSVLVSVVRKEKLDTLSDQAAHQGFVADVLPNRKPLDEEDLLTLLDQLKTPPFLLILDMIQDPHNFGACLRTADAAGVHAVIIPKDNSVGITAAVCKTASGAVETIPLIQVTNLSRTMSELKSRGIWLIGMAEEAEISLFEQDLTGPIALVIGQEGQGLRRLTKASCDFLLKIPMAGTVSSLNASVATGITLFEAVKQRTVQSRDR